MENLSCGVKLKWYGFIAAEPPCGLFHELTIFDAPLLVLKGGESHYATKRCQTMAYLYQSAGSDAEIAIYPKSNHYFSHKDKFIFGLAVNICGENPVTLKKDGRAILLDGSRATRKIIRKNCFTQKAGFGKPGKDLHKALENSTALIERLQNNIDHTNSKI